jgi:SM-20-related protein
MDASLTRPVYPSGSRSELQQRITAGFSEQDWVCCPGFLGAPRITALRRESEILHAAGRFHAAGIGQGVRHDTDVRGDEILWLEDERNLAPEAARVLRDEFSELREAINAVTFLGLQDFEGHYAVYPPGACYTRHVDRFKGDSRRVISVVLYLNDAWGAQDGGELCLYRDQTGEQPVARIVPQAGTLVCFLSAAVPHEVLAARRTRLSLTGWFRRRA